MSMFLYRTQQKLQCPVKFYSVQFYRFLVRKNMSSYHYTEKNIKSLEISISPERLSTYLRHTNNHKEKALKLYLQNTTISADFYILLQHIEITLRNALHNMLKDHFSQENWYECKKCSLAESESKLIEKARKRVGERHEYIKTPHVIAELSFGFWVSLLAKKYHQNLWIPALHKSFPHAVLERKNIYKHLEHLRNLRNRIAHHEPIFMRNLGKDYEDISIALKWLAPDMAAWIKTHKPIPDLTPISELIKK